MAKRNTRKHQKNDQNEFGARALRAHKKLKGKLQVVAKAKLRTKADWSTYYTPGVGAVAAHLGKKPGDAREYTIRNNTVAVVSDGSAVLGLGNIGPYGALPVMEGKCAIFKEMAGVDAFPIVLESQDADTIVETVRQIAPTFGGINLEDISAPRCFEVEERLKKALDIPVMHDDQHGTAIVVLAGLINAAKVAQKNAKQMKVVVVGAGAAGRAITLLLLHYGLTDVTVADSQGVICSGRKDLPPYKKELARLTNRKRICGSVTEAAEGADVLIGVSGPGRLKPEYISVMNEWPIIFALANPIPEIMPEEAKAAGAHIIATGRSDFPNQVNNALVFPGIFRGALDRNVRSITDDVKVRAAERIAALVKEPRPGKIIPSVSASGLVTAVAGAVR